MVRPGDAVEIDRTVTKDGVVSIAGSTHLIGFAWAGRRVTLPLPPGSLRAQRKVHDSGRIMVTGQNIKLGPRSPRQDRHRRHRRHPSAHPAWRRRDRRTPTTKPQTHHPIPRHRRSQPQQPSSISRRQPVKNVMSPYTDNVPAPAKRQPSSPPAETNSADSEQNLPQKVRRHAEPPLPTGQFHSARLGTFT